MSYTNSSAASILTNATNNSNALTSLTNMYANGLVPIANTLKAVPNFKFELYKAQNEGFILSLITTNPNTYTDTSKLFVLKDIENMGRDIQHIIATEILKS